MILIVFTVILGWIIFNECYWKRRNLPPGPTPLPLIGNTYTLSKYEPGYGAFELWKKQYGPVYTFWLGTMPLVVITDYKTMKETFVRNGECFSDKYTFPKFVNIYRGGYYGIMDVNGETWKDHRRFVLHHFRDFGLGKNAMEERIILEVEELTKALKNCNEVIPKIQDHIDVAVGSIINQLLFGYRFDESHLDEFMSIKQMITEIMRIGGRPDFLLMGSFFQLRHFPHFKAMATQFLTARDKFFEFFQRHIEAHREELRTKDSSLDPNDYVEAYLKEQEKRESEGDKESFSDIQLVNTCHDLWLAGLETTSNTLTWCIVYVLNHPEVQEKIHKELDDVIGSERIINMSDKNNLPYFNAVLNETQRMANLLPMNLLHSVNQDCMVGEHLVKSGTGIVAQISTVLYDEHIFPEPEKFKPERFIDENGKLRKVDELIPFSIGKRQCLGEGLARMELFLFGSNFFNRFTVEPDIEVPTMKKVFGASMIPQASNCRISFRF